MNLPESFTVSSVKSTGVNRDWDPVGCGKKKSFYSFMEIASLLELEWVGSVGVSEQLHHIVINTRHTDLWLHQDPPSGMPPVSDRPRHIQHTHTQMRGHANISSYCISQYTCLRFASEFNV